MTSPRDARLAYALLKIKQKEISDALKKVQLLLDQGPGDKNTAKLGEAKLGRVQMTDPETKAVITDEALFVKFVQEARPDHVEDVPTVNATFIRALLEEMARKRDLTDWDGNRVPGVGWTADTPQQRFYPEQGAAEMLTVVEPADLPDIEGVDLAALLGVQVPESPVSEGAEDGAA